MNRSTFFKKATSLCEGFSELSSADISFALSSGYAGMNSASGLAGINRAIAARVALYDQDYSSALSALGNSFMNLDATTPDELNAGPAFVYGRLRISTIRYSSLWIDLQVRSLSFILDLWKDMLDGDSRSFKFAERVNNPASSSDIPNPGNYQDGRWASNDAPIPYIRNEELILIYAAANAMTGNATETVRAINVIRNIWGVGDYTGDTDADALLEEILFQRRYSLWAEGGHRWIDLRRTNGLNENYLDLRGGGTIFTRVERRTSESN